MALFTPSPIMNELRKKASSDVFSKNHYGGFIRKRVKGTNPKSVKQLNVRAAMSELSKAWKGLSQAVRDGFTAFGSGLIQKNRLGQNISYTGEVWWIKLNQILVAIGGTTLSAAPSSSATPPALMVVPTVTATSGSALGITYTTFAGSNTVGLILASKPLSQGKTYNSNYRIVGTTVAADAGVKDLTAGYTAAFGRLPVTGEKVFVKILMSDKTTGLRNSAQAITKII